MASAMTLTSTSAVGQLLETVVKISMMQSDTNANPNGESYITSFTVNPATNRIDFRGSITFDESYDANDYKMTAIDGLVDVV